MTGAYGTGYKLQPNTGNNCDGEVLGETTDLGEIPIYSCLNENGEITTGGGEKDEVNFNSLELVSYDVIQEPDVCILGVC